VRFTLGVVPLRIEAPGARVVLDGPTFWLAGSTLAGGSVSVAGRPLAVNASGQFAQLMNVSSVGETTITVRATAPDHAPRLFPLHVRRVPSLAEEAKQLSATALSWSLLSPEAPPNALVKLEGTLTDVQARSNTTVMLLEGTHCKSPPCLARLLHGARPAHERGQKLQVFGSVTGWVDGVRAEQRVPEVRVEFLLPLP
jgi:hypothetical protein